MSLCTISTFSRSISSWYRERERETANESRYSQFDTFLSTSKLNSSLFVAFSSTTIFTLFYGNARDFSWIVIFTVTFHYLSTDFCSHCFHKYLNYLNNNSNRLHLYFVCIYIVPNVFFSLQTCVLPTSRFRHWMKRKTNWICSANKVLKMWVFNFISIVFLIWFSVQAHCRCIVASFFLCSFIIIWSGFLLSNTLSSKEFSFLPQFSFNLL